MFITSARGYYDQSCLLVHSLFFFISAPSLGVNNWFCLSVRLSQNFKLLLLFLFLDGIEPFLAVSSSWPLYKTLFLHFWFRTLTPKIYSPKFANKSHCTRLVRQIEWRCLGLTGGFWGWPIQWNHAKCCGTDLCCHGNEIWARRGDPDGQTFLFSRY